MARRIDEIEVVHLTVTRLVLQCCCLRLDGDAPLFLDIHRVEHLRFHLPFGQASTALDQAVGQRGLTVVDVRNDGEISDVFHQRESRSKRDLAPSQARKKGASTEDAP